MSETFARTNGEGGASWLRGSGMRLIRTLGRGGVATVYLVEEDASGQRFALKVLHMPHAGVRRRLQREGELQGRLRHDNIVAVHRIIELERGLPGLLMELVDGPTLSAFLGPDLLNIAQLDSLARQVMAGVCAAHAAGAVHRDLKPGNILLALDGDRVVAKVTDFGIARLLTEEGLGQTMTGDWLGTPAYMAPEQITDPRRADQRADIFALGVVLYQLATGSSPWQLDPPVQGLDLATRGDFAPPRALRPDLPERMDRAIRTALCADPADRWCDCEAFLTAWSDGTPPPAEEGLWPARVLEYARGQISVDPDSYDEPALNTLFGLGHNNGHPGGGCQ